MSAIASSDDLERLGALIAIPDCPANVTAVTLAHLAAWKPLIERLAFEKPAEAEEAAGLVVCIGQATGDDACRGLSLWIGANVRFILDRPLDALRQFEEAETLYRARGETLQIARLSVGKISALDKLGRYDEALGCGLAIAPLLAASADPADQRRLVSVYNGIGISSEHLGRLVEAVEAYERKWRWWRDRAGDAATVETARAAVNIGVVNTRLGQYTEAAEAFGQARRALAGLSPTGQMLADIARIDMNLAWLAVLRRSPPEIVAVAFAQARTSRSAADPESASTDLALLDLFHAEWLVESDQWMAIERARIEALHGQLSAAGLAFETARAELLLGQLALAAGDSADALARFTETAAVAARRGDHESAYLAGVYCARGHRAAGASKAAQATLEAVLADVEQVRGRLSADEYRAGYLEDKLIAYRELAALYLADGDVAATLRTIERARARALAELLTARRAEPATATEDAATAALVAEQDALRAQLALIEAGDTARRRDRERQIADLRRRIARAGPRLAADQVAAIPTLDEVCGRLPADTLLLAYAVLPDRVVVFLFDRDGPVGQPIPVGPLLQGDRLRLDLARIASVARLPRDAAQRWAAQQIRSALAPLGDWFEQYLGPLRAELDHYGRLLIVPDHLLTLLPFSALYDRRNGRYLAQSHELLVAPSLTTWMLLACREAPAAGPPLAVGFSSGGRLRRAVDEARAVAAQFPGARLLIESDATRANLAAAAHNASMIHLATHGLYRADTPAFSFLELADGRLEAFDIARLNLNAATVVLSACETGIGHLTGNELLGLARAFLHAGARSVLATHWAVDDEATADLVADFAGRVAEDRSVASALHATQADWLATHSTTLLAHPYFWGGLTLVGTDAGLTTNC
jgi:CHAT domain-containing protein